MRDGKNNKKSEISLKLIMHCQQRMYVDMKGLYQQIALLTEVQSQKNSVFEVVYNECPFAFSVMSVML